MADSVDGDLESEPVHSLRLTDCDKDFHCIPHQNVAKLSRSEVEDLYYQLHDENIHIKQKFNNFDHKYKLMAARVRRLSRDHKCPDSANCEEEQNQIRLLKNSEANLKAKLAVLRGQLSSHTRLHSAALSKPQPLRSHHSSGSVRTRCCSSCGGDDLPDSGRTCQSRNRSTSRSGSRTGVGTTDRDHDESQQTNKELHQEITNLRERVALLQQDMEHASTQSRQRISELETELATHLSNDVAENVELIRARRNCKQLEATLTALQQQHQSTQRELQATKAALGLAARDQDEVCTALAREKQRATDLQQEVVTLTHNSSTIRELEEQLKDLKKENAVLKEHSNRLLQLTTSVDGRRGAGEGEQVRKTTDMKLKLQNETTEAERDCKQLELRLTSLRGEKSHLQELLATIQTEVSQLKNQLISAREERSQSEHQLTGIRSECLELGRELLKTEEEQTRLKQQLMDLRNECTQLETEMTKAKNNVQHLKMQPDTKIIKNETEMRPQPSPRKQAVHSQTSPSRQPFYHSPQQVLLQPAQQSFYQVPLYPSSYTAVTTPIASQPVTPRTSGGDACLALLEQTAIRSPMSAVIGAQGSLQERFLELCLSAAPPQAPLASLLTPIPTSSSTPLPPTVHMHQHVEESSKDADTSNNGSEHPSERRPLRAVGEADTAWELDRCRELLRVQCNLNSMYKKEVSSLNQIVKTLTRSQSADR